MSLSLPARAVCILVLLASVSAPLVGTASDRPQPVTLADMSDCSEPTQNSNLTITAVTTEVTDDNQTSLTIAYTISADALQVATRWSVTDSTGFYKTADGYVWDGRTQKPSLTIELPQYGSALPRHGENWSLIQTPPVNHTWVSDKTVYCSHLQSVRGQSILFNDGLGALPAGKMIYIGDSPSVTTRTIANNTTARFVIPPSVPADDTVQEDYLTALNATSHELNVNCTRDIILFAVPGSTSTSRSELTSGYILQGQSTDSTSSAWIDVQGATNSTHNPLIHEYIHSRQCFQTAEDMQWFTEASARHYEVTLPVRTNDSTSLDTAGLSYKGQKLSDPSTWSSRTTPYTKGSKVLFILETRIRTDSNQTLDDVVRWMNEQDDPVTYAEFREHIVSVTDEETGSWLDETVTNGKAVEVKPHHRRILFNELTPNSTTTDTSRGPRG